jgi:hypothetical protein
MTDLSPATQAVLDALYMDELNGPQQLMARAHASAALRALAVRINGADAIRQDVLDIADELENL